MTNKNMITIIHGSDSAMSRKYFIDQKNSARNPFVFEGEKITISELMQSSDTGMLFEDEKKIFIEDFFSKRKPGKEYNEILNIIKESRNTEVFFWEKKELTKKQISHFPNATLKTFNHPQVMFSFLEGLKPGNKSIFSLFHKTLEQSEPELVFYMIVRHFRLLLALSSCHPEFISGSRDSDLRQNDNNIDEVNYMASWQKSKLSKQASLFSLKSLRMHYKKLFEIDLAIKTGKSSLNLVQSIDFLLLDI